MEEKSRKIDRVLGLRIVTLMLLDLFAVNLSALGALLLRFELSIGALAESGFVQAYLKTAPLYSAAAIILFALCRLYRSLWQYASIDELRYIIRGDGGADGYGAPDERLSAAQHANFEPAVPVPRADADPVFLPHCKALVPAA